MKVYIQAFLILIGALTFAIPVAAVINGTAHNVPVYDGPSGTGMVTAPVVPSWSGTETLSAATQNVSYSHDLSQYLTGTYTPTCSLTTGSLPTGVTLSSACVVSGTPTDLGTFPITVTGTNGAGSAVSTSLSLVVSAASGTVVTTDAELATAISNGDTNILVASGTYTTSDFITGVARTSGTALTIQAQDINNHPVFQNVTVSLAGTQWVTLKNLTFQNTGTLTKDNNFFYTASVNSTCNCHDLTFDGIEFINPFTDDPTDTTPYPAAAPYMDDVAGLYLIRAYDVYNYTISNNTANYAYKFGGFLMNGTVEIHDNTINVWYYDVMRIGGARDEFRIAGDKRIYNNYFGYNLTIYEELNGTSDPHPDLFQMFSFGGTNPRIEDLLFWHNSTNANAPATYRNSNTQWNLTQTRMENVGYVENLITVLGSAHGITLEFQGDGILIEQNTVGDVDWGSSTWIRICGQDGQVVIKDTYYRHLNTTVFGSCAANNAGYELTETNSDRVTAYASFFGGSAGSVGQSALFTSFTPASSTTIGALTNSGIWQDQDHLPMRAEAPTITPGTGQFTITTINDPTLWAPGHDTGCSSYDERWSPAGTYSWTTQVGVSETDVITGVTAGSTDVQIACVNSVGRGLWSKTATVTVN